jgi:hypothetical protein
MIKLFARFLVALVNLATVFLSRWLKLTVRARVHDGLAAQIQFLASRLEDFTIFGLQTAHQGQTDHAAVAADPDLLSGQ